MCTLIAPIVFMTVIFLVWLTTRPILNHHIVLLCRSVWTRARQPLYNKKMLNAVSGKKTTWSASTMEKL